MKNIKRISFSILCCIIFLVSSGCTTNKNENETHSESPHPVNNEILTKSIYIHFENLTDDQAIKKASAILKGEVIKVNEEYRMNNEIMYHTVEIKVVQSKNTDYAIGSIVTVKELGGIWENEKFMYSPSVVFQLGEEVIVFLDDDSYVLHQCFKFNQISSGEFVRNDGVKYDAGFAERLFQKKANSNESSTQSAPSYQSGNAKSFIQPNLTKEIGESALIVEGIVTDIAAPELIENHAYSCVTFTVSEVIRGDIPSKSIKLMQSGGTINGIEYSNNDGFTYQKGQRLILILSTDDKSQYTVSQYFVKDSADSYLHYGSNEKFSKRDFNPS